MKPQFKFKRPEFQVLTYTALQAFRNCRKKFDYRYNQQLVPIEREDVLHVGSIWHQALEIWYKRNPLYLLNPDETIMEVHTMIDEAFPDKTDEKSKANWHLLRAMFNSYVEKYPKEDFEVLFVEEEFGTNLRYFRPAGKKKELLSRLFGVAGKVDAIVQQDNQFFIMEHKTASALTGDYLDKLPMDMQIHIYARFVERCFDIPISGIIYNIAVKARLQQRKGESGDEYQARCAELIAKSKSGKTTAQRKMPETDAEFEQRLMEKYSEPGMFHREVLYLAEDDLNNIEREIWDMAEEMRYVRRKSAWQRNTDFCFRYNRPCTYFPLCRSNDSPIVRENLYTTESIHNELSEITDEVESPF